ncbi:hydrocephalus-inducing protein homolog isoform X1 [Dendroctonus ponderosae]|uniref:hydrocephalus-inducing protein homolog isoform X1 n=1 Tax=Dendroctonus ponderosae TaxID=77166 RepID=UPI002035C2BE|nr:hydrocephalus-inducing protein homolog isoform X1 [Dendroctonus ponderosae]
MAALSLSTEDRLEKMRSSTRKYKITSKNDSFIRCPEAIIFQNFKIGEIYTTSLVVTNQRSVTQCLKVYFEPSRFFTLSMDMAQSNMTKFVPGLSKAFQISFVPTDAGRDFKHEIKFVGELTEFIVPIYALGPRPIAHMPDVIRLPPTLVKVETSATIVLRNTGKMPLNYSQLVDAPFFCSIPKAILAPDGILESRYHCYPTKPGFITGKARIYFRYDFCITVDLECDAKSVKVQLDTHLVTFEDIFMGLCSRKVLSLYNGSDYPLNFAWKMNDKEDESCGISKLVDLMEEMKEYEQKRFEKLEYLEIVDGESHAKIYDRIFEDEKFDLITKQGFLFRSKFFQILPKVGKVLPKSTFEFSVVFQPSQNIFYYSVAYLDIEGTERRTRVSLQGYGIGPPVVLTVKSFNVGQIFLTDKHQYELAVRNKGVIPATVTYQPKETDWGGTLSCVPNSLVLKPDSTRAFVVLFYSKVQGEFIETLDFKVEESGEPLQCIISGTVVCPLLKCVPDAVVFGTVSVGSCNTQQINLVNESRVTICFDFEFEDEDSIGKEALEIVPTNGKVPAYGTTPVKMLFYSDATINLQTNVLLVMWKSRQYSIKVPIHCICACPQVTCEPKVVNIKFCFLNCNYTRTITLTNQSDSPGSVEYIPQKDPDASPVFCAPNISKLFFEAHQAISLELQIRVSQLGSFELPLVFSVIGGISQTLCTIICNGQGPVVSYQPDRVDFGKIKVLRRYEEKLTLVNDSPIAASVRVFCKNDSWFHIEESESSLELSPEEETQVTIWAMFNSPGPSKDTICVEIYQGDTSAIKVSAVGEGTSILCEPPLAPMLNFGILLTYKAFAQEVQISNKGSHRHKMLFTKSSALRSLKETEEDLSPSSFSIEPRYLELDANCSTSITIKSFIKKPRKVSEEFYCQAVIGKSPQIRAIIQFTLEAEFVDPKMSFSQNDINFNLDVYNFKAEGKTEDVLEVDNKTGIPLQVRFTLDENDDTFAVADGTGSTRNSSQDVQRTSAISVHFTPTIKEKRRYSQNARLIVEYGDHPKTDIINLHGEVMFPTIKLYPDEVNFHCVALGSTAQANVLIHNISNMVVEFQWFWLQKSIDIVNLDHGEAKNSVMTQFTQNTQQLMVYIDHEMAEVKLKDSLVSDWNLMGQDVKLCYDSQKYLDEMKKVLFAVFPPDKPKETESFKPLAQNHSQDQISKIFSLVPSEGILMPNEYSIVTIGFTPPPNTEVTATAVCKIQGGEEEHLTVTGRSSKLRYSLDKRSVYFGNQIFCEVCSAELTLTNTGLCAIEFKVVFEEVLTMQAEMLDVTPKIGSVPAGGCVSFKIGYFPGYPGKFSKTFSLELGYLEAVPVNVHGYAVCSQVHLNVPRSWQLDTANCYKAVAWITPEYLEGVQSKARESDDVPPSSNFLDQNDWVYVSHNEIYPSLVDISMAMERIVAFNLVSENPKLLKEHTNSKKIPYIPSFFPSPYIVDFGYIVRDISVCYTILIYNYGPIAADIKLLEDNKTALLEKEIKIEYKPKIVAMGESIDLYVLLSPTKRKCLEVNQKIEAAFRLSVKHGAVITVKILAEVTLPVVSLEHENLYFESVHVGDVLRKSIILSNYGNVQSKWFGEIIKPNKKDNVTGFFMIPSQGQLEPGEQTRLDIYFVPSDTRTIRRTLRIDVESNSEPLYLFLHGHALEASLMILPGELTFAPTLNFFQNSLSFAVQNMAEIPLEFCFPSLDPDFEQERQLVEVYLTHKNLKYAFVPMRIAGSSLPDFFATTYNDLVCKLRKKLTLREETEYIETAETGDLDGVEAKPPHKSGELEDPLLKYSPKELNSLLMDYMTAEGFEADAPSNTTTYKMEDSSEKIEIVEAAPKPIPEEVERKGVLFIFHGAPNTAFYKGANQFGMALSIPVYSIDRLIIESLLESTHSTASDILAVIDNAVMERVNLKTDSLSECLEDEDSEYDKILEKIQIILTTKPKKQAKVRTPKEKGSKASSDKSPEKGKEKGSGMKGDCFLNISLDNLVELIKPKLKSMQELIIESLSTTFILHENQALYALLRAAGPLLYINLVLFSYTISDFVKNEADKWKVEAEKAPIAVNIDKSRSVSPPVQKTSPAAKKEKASAKTGSDKMSKISRGAGKSGDMNKKILQGLSKSVKAQLEAFENLRQEIWHIAQYWDKHNATLRKPYSSSGSKKDASSRDSARTNRNSMKKPNSIHNMEVTLAEPGLFCWLIVNCPQDKDIDYPEVIRNCIKQDENLQKCLKEIEESKHKKLEESQAIFSVISKVDFKKADHIQPPVFSIRNCPASEPIPLKDRSKTSLIKVKRKRSSRGSRKSADSRYGNDSQPVPFTKASNDAEFSPKTVLQPGDLIKYQVTFCPEKSGMYKYKYNIVTTASKTPYQVLCNAICEFPRLDTHPEIMFPKTLENYKEKASYDHFVFIKDQKIFDFGSIVAGPSPEKCLEYTSSILLRNASSSPCEVYVSLSNDAFSIEPSSFIIPPNSDDTLKVSTKSIKAGTFTTQMYISIKNNPVVEDYTLACSPCKLEFSIFPRIVNFDKVPLHYSAKRIVKLTNTSPINLRWEFVEPEWAAEILEMPQTQGFIGLYSVSDVVFRFTPTEEMVISKKLLQIRVFDVNSTSLEPCFIENLPIHVESVEYNIEFDHHIDFGDIKGGVDHKTLFAISNKGKCEIALKIEVFNNPLESHNFVREYFKMQPLLMTIGAQKSDNLSIIFHPKRNFSIQNLLIFVVSMMESIQSGHVVQSYKVTASASSFMPNYEVCPASHLNFGHVQLLAPKKLKLVLTNNGRFPFSFSILNYQKFIESLKKGSKKGGNISDSESKKGKKSARGEEDKHKPEKERHSDKKTKTKSAGSKSSTKTEKKKATKITKLDVGGFSIVPSTGFVAPGDKLSIDVEIAPNEMKDYKEKILLNIPEIEDKQKNKVISLEAIGCEPKINLTDPEGVFLEQFIVANVEDFVAPKNAEGCVIFSTSDCSLHFKRVCINTPVSTRLNLKNIGFVPAYLSAKVDDGGKNVFSLISSSKTLEPYCNDWLQVVFKPNSLEQIRGMLELSYNASSGNKLVVQLHGQACLPQIKLKQPAVNCAEPHLSFGPLCVGFSKSQRIVFENIGEIKCKVIAELSPSSDALSFVPIGETLLELNVHGTEYVDEMKHNVMVNLAPQSEAEFDVVFKPTQPGTAQAALTLHTIQNPYEVIKILIISESFNNEIIFERLEPTKISTSSKSLLNGKNSIGYLIDLGYKQLNRLYKQSFLIRNRSVDTYRFQFYSTCVLFIPEVGHLKPGAWKEVLVIFKSSVPVQLHNEAVSCSVTKIQYVSPDGNMLSWDDRQKFVYWIPDTDNSDSSADSLSVSTMTNKSSHKRGKSIASVNERKSHFSSFSVKSSEAHDCKLDAKTKVIMEGGEPEFITVAETFEVISLYVSVAADYARYESVTNFINFRDTFIKEETVQEFEVKNSGVVPLNITWELSDKNRLVSVRKSSSDTRLGLRQSTEAPLKSASSSSLFLSIFSQEIEHPLAITIESEKDRVEPGETRCFLLKFAPQEVGNYEALLKSKIDCLDPDLEEMCLLVTAKALPVPFYFELDDLPNTNQEILLEFENIGIATESTRQLTLVNPCDHQVTFDITIQDQKEFSYFTCHAPQGRINKLRKYSTSFSFCPPIFGSFTEQYVLNISQENLQRTIKLQGICREPKVNFSENNIVLKSTVPKVKSTKSLRLMNEERFPVSFKFVKKTLFSECQQEKLEVYPIVGKLKPQSESDIKITFTSSHLVTCSFHVKCLIEKRKSPLVLHVSASCIQVQPSVSFTDKSGETTTLKENQINVLDLGSICKGQKEQLLFKIQNIGQTGIFYEWQMDAKPVGHLFKIAVNPEKDFIKSGSTGVSKFFLEPLRAGVLKQFKVALNIMYGPTYTLHINASSEKPNYSFSFNTYNFGHCLVQAGETNFYKTVLVFKNSGTQSIFLQNVFGRNHWLSVDFSSSVVPVGEVCHMPIRFFPQDPGSYKENVAFMLGANRHIIYITGEAVNVKLQLCKPKDKFVNFGNVLVHSAKKYRIGVSNNSPARMSVHFALYDNLIIHTRKMEKIPMGLMKMPIVPASPKEVKKDKGKKKEEKQKSEKHTDEKSKTDKKGEKAKKKNQQVKNTEDRLVAEDLLKKQADERQEYLKSFVVSPNMFIDIPPRGKGHFDITFQPSTKIEFEEKIYFEVQDYIEPLCIIKGASIIPEFTLDKKEVLFLGVITGHSASQFVSLRNSGDVIGSFSWSIDDKQQSAFTIEPRQGFVLPKNDMKFKITFCSADEKCERKIKAKCSIKEIKESLELELKGNSIRMPEPSGTITLKCNVRETVADHSIAITNHTLQQWLLLTELSHDAFSAPREVIVPATNSATIPVAYFPQKMTSMAPDQGTLFIEMPDGSGLIYRLIGHAAPPSAKKRIEKEIRCKQNHFEDILAENWLTVKQIFTVSTEVVSAVTPKTIYQVFGFKDIELAGMESRNYKWGVYVVNEGPIEFKVTFTNPQTGEYEFFEISFKVLSSEPVEVIKFHGRVREHFTQHFTLENPVDVPVTYDLECAEKILTFPNSLTINPYTSVKVDVTYSPLLPEDISTTLSAKCDELGTYTFLIKMKSDPPRPESPIIFRSELGFKTSKTILFQNTFERPVDFATMFSDEEFHMERCNSIPPGETSKIVLTFEPSALGCLNSQLVLVSPVAGQYIYPLVGEGILPTPKGPFIAKQTSPAVIEFKNPFKQDRQFKFCLQPDIFCCDFGEDLIKAGRSTRYVILLRSGLDIDGYKTGKLVISLADNPEVQWKYYLETSR